MKRVSSIQIIQGGRAAAASVQPGENLLSALRRAGYSIPAACGGKGRCGKCRVPVNGVMRLACRTMPQDGDTVELPITSGGVVLTSTGALPKAQPGGTGLAAAVDLGTTTAALRLFDRASGELLAEAQGWNRQASYGADVISRIQYTLENPDGLAELSRCIRGQITELLRQALGDAGRSKTEVRELVLVGNTVMQHIFDGRPVGSIARAPFKPETLFEDTLGAALDGIPVRLAPCVAGYVGGDITAGLLAVGMAERPGERLFLDIGTNGEMALGGSGGILCCAVASGPAFEGAGISCGMPGITGAVSHAVYDRGFMLDVIGGGEAAGLCGSGLGDLAAVLLEHGVIAPGGRLLPPEEAPEHMRRYLTRDENGNGLFHLTQQVSLTAADVRNLQLAKAAVAGGIRVLMEQRHITADELESVEIAGGFGNYLKPESAVRRGMLPKGTLGKLRVMGNTALAGASMLALDGANWERLRSIPAKCRDIELSGRDDFADAFTDNLTF